MISKTQEQILINSPDGDFEVFNPSELQAKIYQACIECGLYDGWLAEDLALSVEYFLLCAGEKREFEQSEIFSITSKLMEEIGYDAIAERFRKNTGIKEHNLSCSDLDAIKEFFYLRGVSADKIQEISERAQRAFSILGIKTVTIEFLEELLKQIKRNEFSSIEETHIKGMKLDNIFHLSLEEIYRIIESSTINRRYLDEKVLIFHPISKLLPAIKVSIDLANFAKMKQLEPPITELTISCHMEELSLQIEKTVKALREKLFNDVAENFPVILKFVDHITFSKNYLAAESDEENCFEEFLNFIKVFLPPYAIIK